MFLNYFIAALRNLARNKLYAAINIGGLAIGFATAIFIALFVRDEFSYDKFIPGHEKTYLLQSDETVPGRAPFFSDHSPAHFAAQMKLDYPQIEAVARIMTDTSPGVRHGDIEYVEKFYWADPNIFDLMPLPTAAGDLSHALEKPNSIVITQNMAHKYFGREDVIGETLELQRRFPMAITAVIKDLPSNTHLGAEMFASGAANFAPFAAMDRGRPNLLEDVLTYVRLVPGASAEALENTLPDFVERHYPKSRVDPTAPGLKEVFYLTRLDRIHLSPADFRVTKPHGHVDTIYAVSAIGLLIVIVASMNFVNLMTARAARRSMEVGIRKVSGATRGDLIVQFMGEGLIYVMLGTLFAMALVELLLPTFNAFLDRTIVFDWWRDPMDLAAIVGFVIVVAFLAGFYPALVLSAFKPAVVVKSSGLPTARAGHVRQILVLMQCATMIGLMLATAVIYRQIDFALNDALRIDKDQVVVIRGACRTAPDAKTIITTFRDEVAELPGVRKAACSSQRAMEMDEVIFPVILSDGTRVSASPRIVDFGFFELYGVHPLAGRLFSRDHPSDSMSGDAKIPMSAPVIINEAAMRKFNFSTPEVSIGKTVQLLQFRAETNASEVIGVVPDYSMDTIHNGVSPAFYIVNPPASNFLSVKLDGKRLPETLRDIDALWTKFGNPMPISRFFLDDYLQSLYADISQQGNLFAVFAGVALFIAALGLLGLSAFSAERRTKEIGIRKAMGASSGEIMLLMLWEFTKPVLWANALAWPMAYFAMRYWLNGFSNRVDIEPWLFLASGAAALAIAWTTVSGFSLLAARGKPVDALRYE